MIEKNDQWFNVISPHVTLKSHVLYYNIVFPGHDTFMEQYTLMPNACGTLSLAFDGAYVKAELWGASVTPTLLGTEPNVYRVLMLIQFSPHGLYQLTRQNQAEFADKRIPLQEVDEELFFDLNHSFMVAQTIDELVSACDMVLCKRMEKPVVSDALLLATRTIADYHGGVHVQEIARQAGYSERHLNRLFLTQIGINVKSYLRLMRFNYVLKHIQKSPCFFATLSQQAGYFDQAHFDKDFKSISGVAPQTYFEKMSDFYYAGAETLDTLFQKGGM